MNIDADILPQAFIIVPGGMEISYVETRHRTDFGHRTQTITLDPSRFPESAEEVIVAIVQLIDEYTVAERRPPDTIRGR